MTLRGYIAKRIVFAFLTIWAILTISFVLFRVVSPMKDPTQLMYQTPSEVRREARELWGITKPLFPDQYGTYLWNMLTWQYGYYWQSLGYRAPIAPEMLWRLKNTVFLMAVGLTGTIAIGIQMGTYAAGRRGKKTDSFVVGASMFLSGFPSFLFQTLFLTILSYGTWRWFGVKLLPSGGVTSIPPPSDAFALMADLAWHAIGPIATMLLTGWAGWAFTVRNMVVSALTEDFVLTAKAKGLTERSVLYKHALRSVLPPIATMIAMSTPYLISGSVIIELVFDYPGIGLWVLTAVQSGNYPIAEAAIYNFSFIMVFANLVADIVYGFLDPRIRIGERP